MQSPVSQVSAATLTGGRWVILAHASLSLSSSPLLTNNGADVTLAGPGASFSNLGDLTENDGALSLLDGATFGTSGNLLNAGTLSLGTGSVLNVGGNFTQGPGATLGFQLGGTPASGLFGQLKSTGTATLAGTLNIAVTGGYVPSAGDRFAVMSYASASGTFSSITGLSAGRTQLLEAVVGSASVVIDSLIDAADLAMGTITIPANGVAGQDATINYTVTNNAANPTDSERLGQLDLPDAGYHARPIRHPDRTRPARGAVAGLASYSETLTAPLPGVVPASYHVLVLADGEGFVPDVNRANNLGVATTSIDVDVTELTPGDAHQGTIADGQDEYFRVNLPAGPAPQITASFAEPGGGALFEQYQDVPSPAAYDQLASDPTDRRSR